MSDMMNRRAVALGALAAIVTAKPALACVPASCTTAQWQATRQPYRGKTAPSQVDTCVRLLASTEYNEMTEVILVEGTDAVNGRVITSLGRGNGHAFTFHDRPSHLSDVYVREFCFEGRLIRGLRAVTFCNGFARGDGNHHTLSLDNAEQRRDLQRLQQDGDIGTFLTLLGEERTYGQNGAAQFFNSRSYSRVYSAGQWVGS